jgi:pyrophosphatase PpaX
MLKVQTVIFDLSGTLIDDLFVVWQANLRTLKDLGILSNLSIHEFKRKFKLPYWEFLKSFGVPEDLAKKEGNKLFWKFYRVHKKRVRLVPGAKDILQQLKKEGLKVGVVSQISKEFLLDHLRTFNIYSYFNVLVSAEDCKVSKPSPLPILKALKKLKGERVDGIYVGDMREDILAGKGAGVITVAVSGKYSYHSSSLLEKERPDYIIGKLDEMLPLLGINF